MWCKRVLLVLFASGQLSVAISRELEIVVGSKVHRVDSRENQGQVYYELDDVARILGLGTREDGDRLVLTGARGRLVLSAGRPLVGLGDQYVLLSAPVWKRKSGNWYVPDDLLSRALPSILARKLEKISDHRYRVSALGINLVQVRLANYPDHVRIVFQPSRKAPVRVKEFGNYIQVEFARYLVRPELPRSQPDRRIVASLDFNPEDVYGTFQIYKGKHYYNYREFTLKDPNRRVVDVYGPPTTVIHSVGPTSTGKAPRPDASSVKGVTPESASVFPPQLSQDVITIDPGHGGDDYGVELFEEMVEKNFTLEVARRIGERLEGSGYRVLLTRGRDVRLSTEQRSSVGNYYRSKVYLSIHAGGSPTVETHGPVVYAHRYLEESLRDVAFSSKTLPVSRDGLVPWEEGQRQYLDRSLRLAESIQYELNRLYGFENEVVETPLAVLAPITAPAVLIEAGFLTHEGDSEKLASVNFQSQLAEAIVAGVLRFLK